MVWRIETHASCVVVTMQSNPVNRQSLQYPSLQFIQGEAVALDRQVLRVVSSPDALRAHSAALDRLKSRSH